MAINATLVSRLATAAVLAVVLAAGCASPMPLVSMVRWWSFHKFTADAIGQVAIGAERQQIGGIVSEVVDFGPMLLFPPEVDLNSTATVFSNDTGETYWVDVKAPHRSAPHRDAIGNSAQLQQYQFFRKATADAFLRIVITRAFFDSIDSNGSLPLPSECPWRTGSFDQCRRVMHSWISFSLTAFSFDEQRDLLRTGGFVEMHGWTGAFDFDVHNSHDATVRLWTRDNFAFDPDVTGTGGTRAQLSLQSPIVVNVPLSRVPLGGLIFLMVDAKAASLNLRQRESYMSAFFRDPAGSDGLSFEFAGVVPVQTPPDKPTITAPAPAAPCTSGPGVTGGTLQFAAATFADPELPGDGATVVVTRVGGSGGAVSARITTSDDTAIAGQDYTAVATEVLFADGEAGTRAVRIPILTDTVSEPDKTVNLTLSAPGGCATLGSPSTATLTIMDDDRPIVAPAFTVGGTVSGLVGSGLVLLQATQGFELRPGNGAFTFGGSLANGLPYDVRVMSQPSNPLQLCTVTNGAGTISNADVTNIVVECVTPPPSGGLDLNFGEGGKATQGLPGGATAMALQSDGKIVLAGGRTLTRYNTDGTLDAAFGGAGSVTVAFGGGFSDVVQAVAIQSDGRIVVAGYTNVNLQNDFAVARYTADGAPDASFGTSGSTRTDFNGTTDRASAVLIQPDGAIVLAGHAATSSPLGIDNDFAVARYTSGGVLDSTFGTGGKVMTNIAGRTDLGAAAVLQVDGRIVVAGRVANGGGDNPDVGLVRYNADGSRDGSFGAQGIVRADLTGGWDEASGVALQPDGKIVVSVVASVGANFVFAVARFDAGGSADAGFGSNGFASTVLSTNLDFPRDVAVQPDGKIVVVGQTSNLSLPNIAVLRYLANGTLDSGFGDSGQLIVDFFGSADGAECVALQPDGKIVVGGVARNGTTTGLALLRILP